MGLQNLDFDFEKFCSVSLSPVNVYACPHMRQVLSGMALGQHDMIWIPAWKQANILLHCEAAGNLIQVLGATYTQWRLVLLAQNPWNQDGLQLKWLQHCTSVSLMAKV